MTFSSSEQSAASHDGLLSFSVGGGNRLRQIAVIFLFLTTFAELSRVLDFRENRIIIGLNALLAIALLASGRILVFWKTGAGRALPFFAGWVILAYVMSPHTRSSLILVHYMLVGCLLFLSTCELLTSLAEFRKMFWVIASAGVLLCILGILRHGYVEGRLVSYWGPNYVDPNDYAMALLALAPIIWVSFPSKPLWVRLGAVFATALPSLMAVRTVSRGGFVAMSAMLVVIFFLSSFRTRIVMASLGVLLLVVVLAFLPDSLRTRLASAARISSVLSNESSQNGDSVSVDSRTTLLETSVKFTLTYPLLGVGPGNFGPTLAEFGRLQGFKWLDLTTHNSYTQISSETGIPGLIFFFLLIAFSFKNLVKVLRMTTPRGSYPDPELHRLASGLLVSLVATCTCMVFLSAGYNALNLFWLGLPNGLRLLLPEDPEDETELVEVEPGQALET